MSGTIERTYVDDLLEYIDTSKEEAAAILLNDKFHAELDCIVMAHGLKMTQIMITPEMMQWVILAHKRTSEDRK